MRVGIAFIISFSVITLLWVWLIYIESIMKDDHELNDIEISSNYDGDSSSNVDAPNLTSLKAPASMLWGGGELAKQSLQQKIFISKSKNFTGQKRLGKFKKIQMEDSSLYEDSGSSEEISDNNSSVDE
jgi:hypothetical protein